MAWLLLNQAGTVAIPFANIIQYDVIDAGEVVNSPIEMGSFAAYNKVESPLTIGLQASISGTDAEIDEILKGVAELKVSTELLSLQTPEAFYKNLNIEKVSYTRSRERGVLILDIGLIEIRQVQTNVTTTNYSRPKTKNKDSTSTEDTGKKNKSILRGGTGVFGL